MKPRQVSAAKCFLLLTLLFLFSVELSAQTDFDNGVKLYDAGKYAEAVATFKRISEKEQNAEAFYYLGNSYFKMSRTDDAVKAYKRAIELKPNHLLALNNLGTAYHSLHDFKQAVESYEAALRIQPDYAEAIFGLGVAYLELKDKDAALEQLAKLFPLDEKRAAKLFDYVSDKQVSLPILNGRALSLPRPFYPPAARNAHVSGVVIVWISIDETGKVVSASAVRGHPILKGPALEAAKLARFSPTMFEGQPVKVTGFITYTFVAG